MRTDTGVHPLGATEASPRISGSSARDLLMLFMASFLALYFELVVIGYLSTEIRVFAYLKNLALIASFFGIGLGMVLGQPPKVLKRTPTTPRGSPCLWMTPGLSSRQRIRSTTSLSLGISTRTRC